MDRQDDREERGHGRIVRALDGTDRRAPVGPIARSGEAPASSAALGEAAELSRRGPPRAPPSHPRSIVPRRASPAATKAARTSVSRSTKIPRARSRPPGRSSRARSSARTTRTDAMRLARTRSKPGVAARQAALPGGQPAAEPIPAGVRTGRLDRDRVDVEPDQLLGPEQARLRSSGCPTHSRHRGPARHQRWPIPARTGRVRTRPRSPPGTAGSSDAAPSRTPSRDRARGPRRPDLGDGDARSDG